MVIPPEVNFLREMGVDVHWLVAEPDPEAFEVTKAMHNGQQDVAEPGADFTEEMAAMHIEFGRKNLAGMKERVKNFMDPDAIYVFHDPQLVGMLPELRAQNPTATFIFRNHINTDRDKIAVEGSLQQKIYNHIHKTCGVDKVDTYIAHPYQSLRLTALKMWHTNRR